ncbi:choline-sulfatase [Prosthecobacter debontii]|uniref:Choline-sulfatase n=2 Tax=Prosthecobacter debontii TaxID=48467 RepID=A0A1T4Y4P7_9BACT|nr:choline-sulfatase [Prosthecobacter debontii]
MDMTMKALLTGLMLILPVGLRAEKTETKTAAQPDVLVILTDQWSPRYLSWENPEVKTPNLDRMAKEGMIFDACYTTSPVCMPARISLITGLYPHNGGHSVWGNVGNYATPAEAAPMFRDIRAAGYTTAQIGKLHWSSGAAWKEHHENLEDYYQALGLDVVVDVSGPPDSADARGAYARHLRQKGLLEQVAKDLHDRYVKWEFEPRASVVGVEDYHDVFVADEAVKFIGGQPQEKPLCLVASFHSPHPPLDPPGEFATMYEPEKLTLPANVPPVYLREGHALNHAETREALAAYLGKISLVDRCVGQLIEALKKRGTWDNTLVLFTADHGEMMGAHGYLTKGRFYEESARVPLVIRWPGQVQAGRTKAPAQMMDVYPTIVEAIGGELSPGRFAVSQLPVAMGKKKAVRRVAVSEIGTVAPLRVMARDGRYKWWAEEDKEFLFDLDTDPLEMTNLAELPEHRETLQHMREEMLLHLRSSQLNLSAGYKPKVQRLREAEKKKKPKAAEPPR